MTKKEIKTSRQMNIPDGYEEQTDGSFFQFENIGDNIHGKLLSISDSKRYDMKLYSMKQYKDNETIRFHGSKHLDQLLLKAREGDSVYIEYIDEQDTPSGNMKIYTVGVKRQSKMERERER